MVEQEGNTVRALCDLLVRAAVGEEQQYKVRGKAEMDPATRVVYKSYLVAYSLIPDELRQELTQEVEREVSAAFDGTGVVVKAIDDPGWGRCFSVDVEGELQGPSWDDFIGHSPDD